jgi:hypothetical protein
MTLQLNIDFAQVAKENGIKRAVDHAGKEWNDTADKYFQVYLRHDNQGKPFTCESFRIWLTDNFPHFEQPPHNRAYAGVIVRAKNSELIKCIGTVQTKLPNAHKCYASLWEKI